MSLLLSFLYLIAHWFQWLTELTLTRAVKIETANGDVGMGQGQVEDNRKQNDMIERPSSGPPQHWLARVQSPGPPAHWLERVRRDAPGLVDVEGDSRVPEPGSMDATDVRQRAAVLVKYQAAKRPRRKIWLFSKQPLRGQPEPDFDMITHGRGQGPEQLVFATNYKKERQKPAAEAEKVRRDGHVMPDFIRRIRRQLLIKNQWLGAAEEHPALDSVPPPIDDTPPEVGFVTETISAGGGPRPRLKNPMPPSSRPLSSSSSLWPLAARDKEVTKEPGWLALDRERNSAGETIQEMKGTVSAELGPDFDPEEAFNGDPWPALPAEEPEEQPQPDSIMNALSRQQRIDAEQRGRAWNG